MSLAPARSNATVMEAYLPRFDDQGRLLVEPRGWQEFEEDALRRLELAPRLCEGLRLLDERRRIALMLREGLELPIDRVAQLLEMPLPEVVRLVHEGRLMLRGFLEHLLNE